MLPFLSITTINLGLVTVIYRQCIDLYLWLILLKRIKKYKQEKNYFTIHVKTYCFLSIKLIIYKKFKV